MKTKKLTIPLILLVISLVACNQNQSPKAWKEIFQANNATGTFVLKNLNTNTSQYYNKERSKKEFVPASTFKILNSMIALQASSINSINDTIKWDGVDRGYKPWNQNQTMQTAFPISCVWFYQELARKTGHKRMQEWITKADYGNKKIGNKIDNFWLEGELAISATGQIDFLEKLVKHELPFDTKIQETAKDLMITDSTENYVIHSKTGWSENIGWNVGYIESESNIWLFALNMDLHDIKMAKSRKSITYDILKEQKIID
ncbi:class D beta-lactamase [Aureibacter tunicatorum]|uniref:Beta-lactamase class D n=1 Tax=Aureibacter tunicatorum TaxID=866807 RepID=A0AAE4BS65_9BACT|nr:class D beta-lactamase [Aureibacter tunicatorum]MDR6238555.1 beta-lactamase class D [Aureibacter tunicatorum]BDD05514.1 beta-lactamase [Aureibacter tunicatorum]